MQNSSSTTTIGLLLSGGLDSSILCHELLRQGQCVQPFYIRCGLLWEREELLAVMRLIRSIESDALGRLVTLDLPLTDLYDDHWSISGEGIPGANSSDEAVYLPGRNLLLAIKAAVWCQLHAVTKLALATLGSSPFSDSTDDFRASFQSVVNGSEAEPVELLYPLSGMTKQEVMMLGRNDPLELTFSCLSPVDGIHCGDCNKCEERRQAFRLIDQPDGTRYAKQACVR